MKFRKIVAVSAAVMMIMSQTVYADMYTAYDLKSEVRLSSGITYERIEKYTSQGWMNVNVIRANLNDTYTKVGPVTAENGLSNRAPLSSMIKSSNAVAAVNGDFFYMGDPTYPYGALIKDGKVMTSPLPNTYGYPTVSRSVDGSVDISVWNPIITLYASDGTSMNVVVYNKTSSIDYGPAVLTSDWNTMSVGNGSGKEIVEVVVVNGFVSEVRVNQPATTIPRDGYIIASTNETTRQQLVQSYVPGTPVSLNIRLDFDPQNLDFAVGGLNYLVKDGQINDISDEVLGAHPRTAIGFNKDNSQMLLVTVDGRNKNYSSVKQTELAQIMIELGAYNVVNMDGGGSTTMGVDFLRNSNVTVVNIPSDGKERKIASGVGVFNTAPESNVVNSLEVIPSGNNVFNGTEMTLDAKGFNAYYAEVSLDKNNVSYSVEPSDAGYFEGNVFKPTAPGNAVITANYYGISNSAEINVLDKPAALDLGIGGKGLILDYGETYTFGEITGTDAYGNTAPIPAKYIEYKFRNRIGEINDGVFTAGDVSNTGAITASFGDVVKNTQVKVGYKMKTLNRFEDADNLKLTLYPEESSGSIELSTDVVKEGDSSLKLNYDFTKMTDQSIAFVEFGEDGEGIRLEDEPKGIGMWVYGDGKSHWLRTRITDANGAQTKLTFADEVDWTGWKWVTAKIPEGIQYPITLKNIYLAEINETMQDTGSIYFDNLRIMYEPNDKDFNLTDSLFTDPLKAEDITNFTEKLTISSEKSGTVRADGSETANDGEIIYIDAIVTGGSLSAQNQTMWNNIKSLANKQGKALVLSMSESPDSISDPRELRILDEILTRASENNQVFVVWKGDEPLNTIQDGIRYITYKDSFQLGVFDGSVQYKN